jgi:hypothetical protein
MRRILASAAALGMAAALLSTALSCAGPTEPKTWTDRVCQALTPWRSQITELNGHAQAQLKAATSPAQARDGILHLLDGAQKASETARSKVAAAGVPDVKGGKEAADKLVKALAAVRDAYAKAQHAVGGLRTDPPDAFYAGVVAAMGTLNQEYARAGVDTDALGSAELAKDFDEAPACRASS